MPEFKNFNFDNAIPCHITDCTETPMFTLTDKKGSIPLCTEHATYAKQLMNRLGLSGTLTEESGFDDEAYMKSQVQAEL